MPKVSIIIPVYNVEAYLHECLESISTQTFTDWECLLIDDGSLDNSGAICDEFARKDYRFKVFHESNRGVSQARNIGLCNMLGEWVLFVDSDDAIAVSTIQTCVEQAETNNLDLLQFSLTLNKTKLGSNDFIKTNVLDQEAFISSKKFLICAGGSLLKSSIIQHNNIRFDNQLKLAEDQLFMFNFMNHARRFQKIDLCLYWYRKNDNSATHLHKSEDLINSIKTLISFKKLNSHWKIYIDRQNADFLIDLIIQKNTPFSLLKKLIKDADISKIQQSNSKTPILFATICRYSYTLAILFIMFRNFISKFFHV